MKYPGMDLGGTGSEGVLLKNDWTKTHGVFVYGWGDL
jgi:hypothetical protein